MYLGGYLILQSGVGGWPGSGKPIQVQRVCTCIDVEFAICDLVAFFHIKNMKRMTYMLHKKTTRLVYNLYTRQEYITRKQTAICDLNWQAPKI